MSRALRWAPFAAVATSHLAALATRRPRPAALTKLALTPALLPVLADGRGLGRSRTVALTAAGLALSWVGDNAAALLLNPRLDPDRAPDSARELPNMAAGFLAAHAAYVAAFGPAALRRRPWGTALVYGAAAAGLAAYVRPRAPEARQIIAPYAAAVACTATAASGLGALGRAGGAAFFASDATLALRLFAPRRWTSDVLVMGAYAAGQALLTEAARR